MALKKLKRMAAASRSREQSPLRPRQVEKMPPCRQACPSGNRIREFVTAIAQAERKGKAPDQAYEEAWHVYTDTSPFPAVCGRVSPHPCEEKCNRYEHDGAVGINKIERAVGDFAIARGLALRKLTEEKRPEKIAVVGAGPAGLSCACQLARRGYAVTVFEAADKPGGMLFWGIPRYRLPARVIEAEIKRILDLGVELRLNVRVGKDVSLEDLRKQYQAVFVSIGAQKGLKLGVEGEDAENVLSGVAFLNRIHHGQKVGVGDRVVVVGGGDTAIDAARICRRLGAETVILYRRTLNEMPAVKEEIEDARAEGVKIEFLAAPVGFRRENGRVSAVKCIRMELGEPDASGRRRPVPVAGSEFEVPATAVIAAISQEPDFAGFEPLVEGRDWIRVDAQGASSRTDGVFAGGDAVKLALVTTAIGQGRQAAEAIDRRLRAAALEPEPPVPSILKDRLKLDHYEKKERASAPSLGVPERLASMEAEVQQGLSPEAALAEARRCMSCGYCMDCEKCWTFCQDQAIVKPMQKGVIYSFKLENCTGCKKCSEECPCGYIDMQ